jgi:hypothetical protein
MMSCPIHTMHVMQDGALDGTGCGDDNNVLDYVSLDMIDGNRSKKYCTILAFILQTKSL